jgi:hypothetical protein
MPMPTNFNLYYVQVTMLQIVANFIHLFLYLKNKTEKGRSHQFVSVKSDQFLRVLDVWNCNTVYI